MIWRSALFLAAFLSAQAAQLNPQATRFPHVRIDFANGIPYKQVWLEYGLYGKTGQRRGIGLDGPSSNFSHVPTGSPFWEIEASVDGRAADSFRAVVWAPGCKMLQFEVPVSSLGVNLSFRCEKLPQVILRGRLREIDRGIQSSVSVSFVSIGYVLSQLPARRINARKPVRQLRSQK